MDIVTKKVGLGGGLPVSRKDAPDSTGGPAGGIPVGSGPPASHFAEVSQWHSRQPRTAPPGRAVAQLWLEALGAARE
jgi:hypothetical protein